MGYVISCQPLITRFLSGVFFCRFPLTSFASFFFSTAGTHQGFANTRSVSFLLHACRAPHLPEAVQVAAVIEGKVSTSLEKPTLASYCWESQRIDEYLTPGPDRCPQNIRVLSARIPWCYRTVNQATP